MDASRSKAIQTRITRLEKAFKVQHNRAPSITELNALYSDEMRQQQKKSRENYSGTGGNYRAARENPAELSNRMSELAKKRWSKKHETDNTRNTPDAQ